MRGVSTTKLFILALLGFCALVLATVVLTLELYVRQEQYKLGISGKRVSNRPKKTGTKLTGTNGLGSSSSSSTASIGTSTTTSGTTSTTAMKNNNGKSEGSRTAIKSSQPITPEDIRLSSSFQSTPPQGQNIQIVQDAYWRQATRGLQSWDSLVLSSLFGKNNDNDDSDNGDKHYYYNYYHEQHYGASSSSSSHRGNNQVDGDTPLFALQRAAALGHPHAQHYLANAYASGIWPFALSNPGKGQEEDEEVKESRRNDRHGEAKDDVDTVRTIPSSSSFLHVPDEWSPSYTAIPSPGGGGEEEEGGDPQHNLLLLQQQQQLNQALLLWQMAAMGGNIESAMALAHRIESIPSTGAGGGGDKTSKPSQKSPSSSPLSSCERALPYWEAAANGIMDELEASVHSRGKVRPPMDQHVLARVHMHGGTSSQLDEGDKPYESKEAIQFLHMKATTVPWTGRRSNDDDDDDIDVSNDNDGVDTSQIVVIESAYPLAVFFHVGKLGVPQNLTQSLMYYEIAARHKHRASAGMAGKFYLWGMGTKQNVEKAYKYFKIGAPQPLETCRRIHEQVLHTGLDKEDECDSTSLTGLGVLHLIGLKDIVPVDPGQAQKYFALAKELGNDDAIYHLAIMWLGWKTHFKYVHELKEDGVSRDPGYANLDRFTKNEADFALHYSEKTDDVHKGPTQGEIKEAVDLLTLAAHGGHLQARHRLAMMYSQGVQIQTAALKFEVVKPSCTKATELFKSIANSASLQRSRRLRTAYKAYMDGDMEVSLRNYLAAAETGSDVGQVNAAFLLERGTCLGLSSTDCAKASVRLWKAAAAKGNVEACLRVGDFYYYGRLREKTKSPGPFGWVQYLIYPEQQLPRLLFKLFRQGRSIFFKYFNPEDASKEDTAHTEPAGSVNLEELEQRQHHHEETLEADLVMAAHFYHEGAEKHRSPRANFNLGFMYEFGLGLKQDFPLAKRHYDLARTLSGHGEADIAVQLSLWSMAIHESIVKWKVSLEDRRKRRSGKNTLDGDVDETNSSESHFVGRTEQDVILSHLFHWTSLLIAALVGFVLQLQKLRAQRRRT